MYLIFNKPSGTATTIIVTHKVNEYKIIDVISRLNCRNIRWVHFGTGIMRNEVERYAQRILVNVDYEFKGIVPNSEILDFYADNYVDLFINLSSSEGIPVSIMEALSAGIPIVATNVGGTSEAVSDEFGFLVPAVFNNEDVATIINNYLCLSISEQQSYRRRAYQFWKENYEAATNYRKFCDILENL